MAAIDMLTVATRQYIQRSMHKRVIDTVRDMGYEDNTDPFGDWVAEVRREQEELDGINGS